MNLTLFPKLTHPTILRFQGSNPSSHSPRFPKNPDILSSLGPHLSLFPPTSDLQAPLESLELHSCSLVAADLTFLSQSIHAPALKKLDLSGLNVSQGLLDPLRLLLEKASASLLYLGLWYCHITNSHLAALLPTLLRCSRLRVLGLYGNPLTTAAIKDLLQKTLELPNLHLVVYPYPLGCHTWDPSEFDCGCFDESLDQQLLSAAEAEISQLLENSGRTNLIWTDNPEILKDLDYFSL
ncbi:leucine-rich repeat-containing protein 14 [Turdus rufiventris]|nr:leucine-rich repeat-containing protein 14 [Turdus rufiventris]